MRMTLDRDSSVLRLIAAGALLAAAGLAGCGTNNSLYSFVAPAAVVVADFNGSGYEGIAVAQAQINELNTTENPGYVALVLQNSSSPGSYQASLHFPTQGNPSAMAVGALTPGTVDLVVANVNDQSLSLLMQTAPNTPNYEAAVTLPAAPAGTNGSVLPEGVAICDVNNDGHPDIVLAYQLQQQVSSVLTPTGGGVNVILQNAASPGTFGATTNVGSAPTPSGYQFPNVSYGLACANLSGDTTAAPDIVMTSFSDYDSTLEYNGGTVSIFFHDPANPGSFLPRVDITDVYGALRKVVIADVNGDGLLDIIVADESEDSNGDGTSGAVVLLQKKPSSAGAQPTFAAPVFYTSESALAVAVGDVNGDGLPDLVLASSDPSGSGSVTIYLNDPSSPGTFQANPTSVAGLGNTVDVALGHLNGKDTLLDIALADGTGAAVMFNTPSDPGSFQAETLVGG